MPDELIDVAGVPAWVCDASGPVVDSEEAGLDLLGNAHWQGASMVVLPVSRLPEAFFELRSGLAGAIAQKFVNYRMRLVVLGDVSAYLAGSSSFADYVGETNRGNQLWFLADLASVERRLGDSWGGSATAGGVTG